MFQMIYITIKFGLGYKMYYNIPHVFDTVGCNSSLVIYVWWFRAVSLELAKKWNLCTERCPDEVLRVYHVQYLEPLAACIVSRLQT